MAAAGTSSKGDMDLGCWCVHVGLVAPPFNRGGLCVLNQFCLGRGGTHWAELFLPLSLPSCPFSYMYCISLFTWYGTFLDNQKFAVEVAINESNGRTVKASVALHLYDGRPAEWRH